MFKDLTATCVFDNSEMYISKTVHPLSRDLHLFLRGSAIVDDAGTLLFFFNKTREMKENRNEWGEMKCIICRLCARVCVWLHLKFFLPCCTKWYNTHHKQALPVRNCVNLLDEGTHLLLPVLPV